MLIPYEYADIPSVEGPGRVEVALGRLVSQGYPGHVLRAEGTDKGVGVLEEISTLVASRGGELRRKGEPFGLLQIGWHVDALLPEHGDELAFVALRIWKGVDRASLLVPRFGFWQQGPRFDTLPREFLDNLAKGRVDDGWAEPVMYRSNLNVGDVLLFAEGGPRPTIHNIENVTPVRRSFSHGGRLLRSRHGLPEA